jgi:flavodoxin
MYAVIDAPPTFDLEKLGKILGVDCGYTIVPAPRSDKENLGERFLQMLYQVVSREPDDESIAFVSKEGLVLIAKGMNQRGELPLDDYRAIKALSESAEIVDPDIHFVVLHKDNRVYENFCEENLGVVRVYVEGSSLKEIAVGIDQLIKERMPK